MAKASSEWGKKEWDDLQTAKRIVHDLASKMDKAERCGIECAEFRHVHSEMLRRLETIEKEYMPQRPY